LFAIQYLSVLQGCYVGLSNVKEEWAMLLSANLLSEEIRISVTHLVEDRYTAQVE